MLACCAAMHFYCNDGGVPCCSPQLAKLIVAHWYLPGPVLCSGGEKQRVAFARAILKNPPILILVRAALCCALHAVVCHAVPCCAMLHHVRT